MRGSEKLTYEIFKTIEYEDWYGTLPEKTKVIIDSRLQRIALDGHFGTTNTFDDLIELKWKSGLRDYTHRREKKMLIVLLGGNKNGQKGDIRKAKKILSEILAEA